GEESTAEHREAEHRDQVRRQPREIEIEAIAEREVHRADRVEVAAAKQRGPWRLHDARLPTFAPKALRRVRRSSRILFPSGGGKGPRSTGGNHQRELFCAHVPTRPRV